MIISRKGVKMKILNKKIVLCGFILSMLYSISAMAGTEYKFIEDDGIQYCIDQDEKLVVGTFYDEIGNFYKTDESGTLFTGRDENKQTYMNGLLINPGTEQNVDLYKALSAKLESGENLTFNQYEDAYQFLEYYYGQYQLYGQSCPCEIKTIDENGCMKYSISYTGEYNRSKVEELISDTFGKAEGDTAQDKIINMLLKLRNMEYDISYQYRTLEESLIDMKGCCWNYSVIGSYLLNEAGIYTECVSGKFIPNNESHSWLRCLVDNKWRYIDPTPYITGNNPFYSNIDPLVYQAQYITTGRMLDGQYLK